ncbi:hypothetical protein BB561_006305 [Smittium simulii]|uniref:Small-subunit processome Utp12 domain-containing protein n=1 Tax=Smittium simulii TaxID=133385 RepID=A0A2T9Y5C5_9FUNG|nr:hypothetical protein BB561_006305 [Smittium simulii]
MVKAYQRYEHKATFGIISTARGNSTYSADGKLAICSALETVLVWDIKKSEIVKRWNDPDNTSQVVTIKRSPNNTEYAVGYADGSLRIFNIDGDNIPTLTFNGHRGPITSLAFDPSGTILCSGSADTDLVLWDMVGESGLFRLKGHKDQITDLVFLLPNNLNDQLNSSDSASQDLTVGSLLGNVADLNLSKNAAFSAFSAGSTGFLVSSSKDTLIKVWDLESRNCVQTVISHTSEVWSIALSSDGKTLITGSSEPDLKIFTVDTSNSINALFNNSKNSSSTQNITPSGDPLTTSPNPTIDLDSIVKAGSYSILTEVSSLSKQSKERATSIQFHPTANVFACQTNDRMIELFYICTPDEIKKKLTKKNKRSKDKTPSSENSLKSPDNTLNQEYASMFISRQILRLSAKIRSFSFNPAEISTTYISKQGNIKVMFSLFNNSVHVGLLDSSLYLSSSSSFSESDLTPQWQTSIERLGHRTEPRCIALSNDNELLATACSNVLRIWNVSTNSCLRELACGHALSIVFLPGDLYVAIGTKAGNIELFSLSSSLMISSFESHENGCYTLVVKPDKTGLLSGGADKLVKFWDFELIAPTTPNSEGTKNNTTSGSRQLSLHHTRTLKLPDAILSMAVSPNNKLVAVSLLDTTIRVFFLDTLKFYLSLYGHKLPALSIDISSDSTLLVSGSADKNIKIWGLDFGDCHKSIYAHKDAVTCVKFVWDTHYLFSSSKDNTVTMWDADKFVKIQNMPNGSHGDVWAIALAKFGNFIASVSQDKTIRIWIKTDEPLFLEEEREKDLEEINEKGMLDDLNSSIRNGQNLIGEVNTEDLENGVTATSISNSNGAQEDTAAQVYGAKYTMDTLKAGEKLVEAVNIVKEELEKAEKYASDLEKSRKNKFLQSPMPPPKHVMLIALKIEEPQVYLLRTIEKIRPSDLEDALLALPLSNFSTLLQCMNYWVLKNYNIQITTKVLVFLLKSNLHQVNNMKFLQQDLLELKKNLRKLLQAQKQNVGVNLSYLKALQRDWELNTTKDLFEEEAINAKLESKIKKRKFLGLSTQ